MEDYRLEQSGQEVQNILNNAASQTDLNAEVERAQDVEGTLQDNINAEESARQQADEILQDKIESEEIRATEAERQNADDIDAIEEKIPSDASSANKLATEGYVNDSVATSTATFRGTFNLVSDLHFTLDATQFQIATALSLAVASADNNDYAFVQIPTSIETPAQIARIDRYKFNGTAWGYEYTLNNSGFTADQWAAINSGITSTLVTKLGALPTAADLAAALLAKQDKLTFDQAPTPSSTNPVTSGGVYTAIDDEKGARVNADAALQQAIEAILLLIPSAATALNQLADKAFVNSSIATDTATFRGTFNLVSDLQLTVDATHADIAAALLNAISTADNNDYAFVQIPTSVDTPTEIRVTERYKFNGTAWSYEYDLNNSGFTAAQWAAINSGITTLLVTKLSNLPNATELATLFAGKQNVLTFDNAPVSGSDNPVKSGGLYDLFAAIDAKMPTGASANNKLVAEDRLAAYVGGIIGALDATFDLTSTDGHVTMRMTQTDGVITSLQILTSDIASASALATLGGQVSTNASDIAALKALYNALLQSAPQVIEPTDTWPVASPSDTVIYRVIDRVNTLPQYYSDYMWNGTAMVLMATYNNAIDDEPTKDSNNLVKSGGVEEADARLALSNNLIYYRKNTPGIYNNGSIIYSNLNIKQGDNYKFSFKADSDFSRIIICYNGNDTGGNRIFDISNGVAGQEYTVKTTAPVDITEIRSMVTTGNVPEIEFSFVKIKIEDFDFNVLHNILDSENVSLLVDNYINDSGQISTALSGAGYRVMKLYIPTGKYIVGNGTGRASLWRYSDDTYATPVERIIPISSDYSKNIVKEVTLTAGYYAISCNTSNSDALNSIYIIPSDSSVNGITKSLIDASIVNTRIVHNYVNTLSVMSAIAVIDGTIRTDVTSGYKAVYIHLEAGRYVIYTPGGTSSSDALWKFTDASCSTLSKQIVSGMKAGEMTFVDVDEGYYIFCFLKSSDAVENAFIISAKDEQAKQLWNNHFSNYTQYAHEENNKYINSSGQISASAAGLGYRVIRLRLLNDGKFYLSAINTGSSCLLAKYTDDTYSTVESIIVGAGALDYKNTISLENGYYALGYNVNNGGKIPELFMLKENESITKRIVKYNEPFNGQYISDLLLNGTASRADDGKITVAGGITNRAYGDFLMAWYYSLSAKFKCSNGVSMIIGKAFGWSNAGDYFEVYKDNDGSYIRRCHINHPNADVTIVETKQLDFSLNENEDYTIVLKKQPLKTTVEIIGSYNEYYIADFDIYSLYGQAFVSSNNAAVVSEFYFGISSYYDVRNLKLVIWGHSYAEATGSTGEQYMNSFPGLLAQAIGEKEVVNMGFGGDIFNQLESRMKREVQYVIKTQYAMLIIGENDNAISTQNAINSFTSMCGVCEQNSIIPIIFTLEPDATGYRNPNAEQINEWIRSSGYHYVDMDKVFWDENGNIRTDLYVDGVHPTILGHRLIFNRIKMDCPFLF